MSRAESEEVGPGLCGERDKSVLECFKQLGGGTNT